MRRARLVAAAAALAVAASVVPASASVSAAPVAPAHPHPSQALQSLGHGTLVKITPEGIEPVNGGTSPLAYCLYHSYDWCLSMSPSDVEAIILGGINVAKGLIELYKLWKTGRSEKSVEKETVNGKNHENQCFGVWKSRARISLGYCGDTHGIYWDLYLTCKTCSSFYLYNTYEKQYLTTSSPSQGAHVWVYPYKKDWQVWGLYSFS